MWRLTATLGDLPVPEQEAVSCGQRRRELRGTGLGPPPPGHWRREPERARAPDSAAGGQNPGRGRGARRRGRKAAPGGAGPPRSSVRAAAGPRGLGVGRWGPGPCVCCLSTYSGRRLGRAGLEAPSLPRPAGPGASPRPRFTPRSGPAVRRGFGKRPKGRASRGPRAERSIPRPDAEVLGGAPEP